MSNYGTFHRRTNALPIVIGVTIILSLFPSSWLGWTSDLADLVRVPVTPVSHIGVMMTGWVRPAVEPSDLPTDEQERNELAISERDQYRQLYHSQILRATELADQLRQLQSLPDSALRNPQPPLILPIDLTGSTPSDVSGIVEMKLIRGASDRIIEGDIAIVGMDVVGRISRVGMTRIELRPTTHRETGLIKAVVVPSHPSNKDRPTLLAEVLLQNRGDGNLFAEASSASGVQLGDLVVLDDSSWPNYGGGLIIGSVVEINQLDQAPLRHVLTITPRRRARDHSSVVVLGSGEVAEQ